MLLPWKKLLQVLKYKSAVFINAHMVTAGLVNNCLWFTHPLPDHFHDETPTTVFDRASIRSGASQLIAHSLPIVRSSRSCTRHLKPFVSK
ncbi:hypothetical protein PC116_g12777 [Phytophthora cactorum]|uniref:Uncharacterized protein n=1 Tax=Phytophthora cactorum TaxID=29920 RepID=A0A8T1C399_9STRA|nr:hypothetical protein PC114_g9424 [Phytophthora cactorum]KAG2912994.1 hypothetical protein PC115_g12173 [Phytophthora cactorum]KAG4052295.1 hypothetical protein PC123_g12520 [Phytophthora cactorum]KAG4239223.1 hypothetical protein PC116_g12777 [Phytophthora cactorum]